MNRAPSLAPLCLRIALAALAAVFVAQPALAETASEQAIANAATAPADDRPVVRIGRALDFEGRPVWSGQTAFSDTARIATLSTSPPAQRRTIRNYSLASAAPLLRGAVTSGFGTRRHPIYGGSRMHAGVDLAASTGSPILATSDGMVSMAGWGGGYGLTVRLDHSGGLETRYGHMSRLAVAPGQQVRKGDVIGYVGSTGASTGPHLHYEMRVDGVPVRPRL